jgi:hypothetical protein
VFENGLFPVNTKFSVVNEGGPKQDVNFVITVAENRGISMKLFNDSSEALQWLHA